MSKNDKTTPPNPLSTLQTAENQARIAKFKAQAEEYVRQKTTSAVVFDPVALLKRASEIHEFTHPTLGIVRFGELTIKDSAVLEQCKSPEAKTAMALYLMLKKANPAMPEYTPENILDFFNQFPLAEGAALLQFVSEQPSFLPKNSLKNGLAPMEAAKT
jgi:hypothetical protein